VLMSCELHSNIRYGSGTLKARVVLLTDITWTVVRFLLARWLVITKQT